MLLQKPWNYLCRYFFRKLSTLELLDDNRNFDKLTKSSEDIASFIRFNRNIQPIDVERFRELIDYNNSKENELKIRLICYEYEYLCHLNARIPSNISIDHMKIMLNMKSSEQRQIFLIKSYFKETKKIRLKAKKTIKRKLKQQNNIEKEEYFSSGIFDCTKIADEIRYGLWKNCLFCRFSKSSRLLLQSGVNSQLEWNPIIAFDWYLSENFLKENNDGKPLITIPEKYIKKLAYQIYLSCNQNLKSFQSSFNIIHLNLNENLPIPIFTHIEKLFNQSSIDNIFFNCKNKNSYQTFFNDKIIYYIDSNAMNIISDKDLKIDQEELIFIFNPYTELIGLKSKVIENIFKYKQIESINNDRIQFRRLPLHDMIDSKKNYLMQSYYIECLRQILFNNIDWRDALYKNVPKKYYKNNDDDQK